MRVAYVGQRKGMPIGHVQLQKQDINPKPAVSIKSVPDEIESSPRSISGHVRPSILLVGPEITLSSFTSALHTLDKVGHSICWDEALLDNMALLVLSTGRAVIHIPLEITRTEYPRRGTLNPILNTQQLLLVYVDVS